MYFLFGHHTPRRLKKTHVITYSNNKCDFSCGWREHYFETGLARTEHDTVMCNVQVVLHGK